MRKDKNIRVFRKDKLFEGLDLGSRAVISIEGERKSLGLKELMKIINKTIKVKNNANNER